MDKKINFSMLFDMQFIFLLLSFPSACIMGRAKDV